MFGVRLSRNGVLLGIASYAVTLLVLAIMRALDKEPLGALALSMAAGFLLYLSLRSRVFGPVRARYEQGADERWDRRAAGVGFGIVAGLLLLLLGLSLAVWAAAVILVPSLLAVIVYYDSKARAKTQRASGAR